MDKIPKLIKLKILCVDECYALSNEITSVIIDSPLSHIAVLWRDFFWLFIFLYESTWIY